MIPHRLSLEADAAAARYDMLTSTWQTLYNRALASDRFGYADQAPALAHEAYAIAGTYFETEKDHIASLLEEIATDAHQSVRDKISSRSADELSDDALTHLAATQSYISDEISAQLHRDIALMRQSLQRAVLDVSMMTRTRRIQQRAALIEYRVLNGETLEFTFTDRRARRTPSKTFIRALWRQTLLSVHNEAVLMELADHGIERAAVLHLEDGFVKRKDVISLSGLDDLPTYGEIRGTVFHPNSNAWLDLETDDV